MKDLIARHRELDAEITLLVEQKEWPGVVVRRLDRESDDDRRRGPGSRRERLISCGGKDDWAIVHGGDWGATYPVPHYTTSLDAAMTLVPEGWTVARISQNDDKTWAVELRQGYLTSYTKVVFGGPSHRDPTPALALCIAALKARANLKGE